MKPEESTLWLENNVSKLFELCGFKVSRDIELNNYKIDLLAEIDLPDIQEDFKVICKFVYEDSEEEVRDLIIEWVEKNKDIKANKVIIALVGNEVWGEDKEMAREKGAMIWEEDNIKEVIACFKKGKERGIKKLMSHLGLATYIDPDIDYVLPGANE